MTHHYKHQWQRPDLELSDIEKIAEFRWHIQSIETLGAVNPHIWTREVFKARADYVKLRYKEQTGRPYMRPEDFDMACMEEAAR